LRDPARAPRVRARGAGLPLERELQAAKVMRDHLTGWQDVRRIVDELELQIHLAGMDARDRWQALQPRLAHVETAIAHSGEHAGDAVTRELSEISATLHHLRDEIYARVRGDFTSGW
jgi:hypothetical protein